MNRPKYKAHAHAQEVLSIVLDPECSETAAIAGVAFLIGVRPDRIRAFLAHRPEVWAWRSGRIGGRHQERKDPWMDGVDS